MRIVIDLQSCQTNSSRNRGIGRYSVALTEAILRQGGSHEIWLALSGRFPDSVLPLRRRFKDLLPRDRIVVFQTPANVSESIAENSWRNKTAEALREHFLAGLKPDIVHVSSLFEGLGDDAVTSTVSSYFPTSATLYDLIPYLRPEVYLTSDLTRSWYMRKIQQLESAALLLAISEHTRQEAIDALNLSPEKVINVSAAVDPSFRRIALSRIQEDALRTRYKLTRQFVMYTGGIDARKNIEGLIDAFAQIESSLRSSYQLAIICSAQPQERERVLTHARRAGLAPDDVVLTGYVPETDLIGLYNLCHLFVFPSLHEGFGLPVLEAMACGAATIGANNSSIPEVIGRQDALFDAARPVAIAEAIRRVLRSEKFRQELRSFAVKQAQRFSWDRSAQLALGAFEQLQSERVQMPSIMPVPNPRPRLAFVSPMWPEKTGIATYSTELLPRLAEYYEIELIVSQPVVNQPWSSLRFPVHDSEWFRKNANRFDRIVYHVGNSTFHAYMLNLLQEHPGVVVLHDFFLSGIIHSLDATGVLPGSFRQSLYRCHGYQAVLVHDEQDLNTALLKYPVNKDVLDWAVGVIVHSKRAQTLASEWYVAAIAESWRVIPHLRDLPQGASRRAARQQLNIAADDFLICSFGIVHPMKLNDRLLEAFVKSSLASEAKCHLVFVGESISKPYGQVLREIIENSPAKDRVRITGYVDSDVYQSYLQAADVAVQLRQSSRGETSGSVLDAMVHGLPLIVNACGTMAELPDEAVIKLPEHFQESELVATLERLRLDQALRQRLASAGRREIQERHDPKQIARQYCDAIEQFAVTSDRSRYLNLISKITHSGATVKPTEADLVETAVSLAANIRPLRPPQLLLDVTRLPWEGELPPSIRAALDHLLRLPNDYRVEPLVWDSPSFRYAVGQTCRFLRLQDLGLANEVADIASGDALLIFKAENIAAPERAAVLQLRDAGVEVYAALDDPVAGNGSQHSHGEFTAAMAKFVGFADGLVSISESAAGLREWYSSQKDILPMKIGHYQPACRTASAPIAKNGTQLRQLPWAWL